MKKITEILNQLDIKRPFNHYHHYIRIFSNYSGGVYKERPSGGDECLGIFENKHHLKGLLTKLSQDTDKEDIRV